MCVYFLKITNFLYFNLEKKKTMLLLAIVLLVAGAGLFYYYSVRPLSYWRKKGVKQTKPHWFFGDFLDHALRRDNVVQRILKIYNAEPNTRYFGFYEFTRPTLLIKDPKLLKQITIKEFDHFMDHRMFIPTEADPLWGRNLFALQGHDWREMRPILSPSYTSNKMKTLFSLMDDCSKSLSNYFLKKNEEIAEVEIKDVTSRFANDVIATTAFGVSVDSFEEPNNEFYKMGLNVTDFPSLSKTLKMMGITIFPKLYKFINILVYENPSRNFFINLILNNLKTREEKGIVRPDMLHLLMKSKNESAQNGENGTEGSQRGITNTDIIAQALIFFFAGLESVSSLMTFMAYELSIHPDIQKKLRKEIVNGFKECGEKWTYEGLGKLKYLDMVVSETLRKWPNFPRTDRICNKDFTIEPELPDETPLLVEKGTFLELPIIAMHYDPKYFPDPERFDPERFNDENKDSFSSHAYFPFGMGPRVCIGSRFALMETKVFFAHLLLHFEIIPTKKSIIPIKLSNKHFNVTPNDGVHVGLKMVRV